MGKVRLYLLVLFLWAGLCSPTAFPQPPTQPSTLHLHKIQLSVETGQKIVSFNFSLPPDSVKAFVLSSPPRLVVDIKGPIKDQPTATYTVEDSLLHRVRVGSHPQRLRFVLDLKTDKVPPFSVEQKDVRVTAVLGERTGESGKVHSQTLFSLSGKVVASQSVPRGPVLTPPPVTPDMSDMSLKQYLPLSQEARHHLKQGQVFYDRGQVDEAIVQWRETVRLAPNVAKAHHLLGIALRDSGDLTESLAAFQEALRLDPDNATACVHLARAFEARGDTKEAFAAYYRALQLVPSAPYVHNRLGHLLAAKGDWEGAVTEWQQTTELLPNYAYAHANLGEAFEQMGKRGEALAAYERALPVCARFTQALEQIGKKGEAATLCAEVRRRVARLRQD